MSSAVETAKRAEEKGGAEARIDDFVALLSLLPRLLAALSEHEILKSQSLGLTEWSFLHAVAENPGFGSGRIARRLGLTPQRVAQVVAALTKMGYITSTTAQDDTRKKELDVTPLGKVKLGAADDKLMKLLQKVYSDRPTAVASMRRNARVLLTAISPQDAPGAMNASAKRA